MRHATIAAIALAFLFFSSAAQAQKPAPAPAPVPAAPIPAQILSAQKIFIANGAGDVPAEFFFPDVTYDEFYAGVKSWNRYTLVTNPADADLIFQVSSMTPPDGYKYIRVFLLDPKTGIRLWGIIEAVQLANRPATAVKNYETAIQKLVADVNTLTSATAPPNK